MDGRGGSAGSGCGRILLVIVISAYKFVDEI
jgi:hypothetical protein